MKKRMRKIMIILALITGLLALALFIFLQRPEFGRNPQGQKLERISQSPNYVDGQFRNRVQLPPAESRDSFPVALVKFLFNKKNERLTPEEPLPTVKTDLKALAPERDTLVWLGHSSFFIRLSGLTFLVDPVFSDYASPVSFANKIFKGTSIYQAEDMPQIDYLLISHDHWDHLDQPSVLALKSKVTNIIVPLGVGSHFERWGFDPEMIMEGNWESRFDLGEVSLHLLPGQHFSGRSLTRNKTLWAGFALVSPERRIFLSGDTGYGPHFEKIGRDFDGFDLVVLDSGQYDPQWYEVHMNPEEAAKAAVDLKARTLLPGHVGKFSIAYHSWDDPFIRITAASRDKDYRLLTPLIGQPVEVGGDQVFPRWWENLP